jgi:hypothetical protein
MLGTRETGGSRAGLRQRTAAACAAGQCTGRAVSAGMSASGLAARLAYGAAFALALPAALVLWARAASEREPTRAAVDARGRRCSRGVLLAAAAMRALWVHGSGLPMNAFPPPRRVARPTAHWRTRSTSASSRAARARRCSRARPPAWLVTPAAAAGCAAGARPRGPQPAPPLRRGAAPVAVARPTRIAPPPPPSAPRLLVHGTWFLVYEGR